MNVDTSNRRMQSKFDDYITSIIPLAYHSSVGTTPIPYVEDVTNVNFNTSMRKPDQLIFSLSIEISLLLAITIGNLSVLLSMAPKKRCTQMKLFIMNLALADCLVAWGGILPSILLERLPFYLPAVFCKLTRFLMVMNSYDSSFALVTLSIDRLHAILQPLRNSSSSGSMSSYFLAFSGWIMSCFCSFPLLILAEKNGLHCILNFKNLSEFPDTNKIYLAYVVFSVFIIPTVIIAMCHIVIIWRLIRASHMPMNATPSMFRGCIPRAKVKTVKMTCVIVSMYVICWSPYMVWNLLNTFGMRKSEDPMIHKVTYFMQKLAPLNSAANPIIYWIFSSPKNKRHPARTQANTIGGTFATNARGLLATGHPMRGNDTQFCQENKFKVSPHLTNTTAIELTPLLLARSSPPREKESILPTLV